jgi:hypothetical protein
MPAHQKEGPADASSSSSSKQVAPDLKRELLLLHCCYSTANLPTIAFSGLRENAW